MNIKKTAKHWFPMRVTYGRQLKVAAELEALGVKYFLPMTDKVEKKDGHVRHKTVPAISNLIFLNDCQNTISELKQRSGYVNTLRYITRPNRLEPTAPGEIIIVPDNQMEDFIKVSKAPQNQVTFVSEDDLKGRVHAHVTITSGPFKGVRGVIKRVRGNKHVVVEIEGVAGVCINFVPKEFIIESKHND
jgi:transcription antitermination factor NusG